LTEEKELPIDGHILAIDHTRDCLIIEDKPYIESVEDVYLFDKNRVTHCCELTPSYYLMFLYCRINFSKKGEKLSDVEHEKLRDKYELEPGEDIYVHTHSIDQLVENAKAKRFCYRHYGDTGVPFDETSRDEQMEALREHFKCDCPL